MNKKIIIYILSWVLKIEAIFLLIPIATAIIYKEKTLSSFLIVFVISLLLGLFLGTQKPEDTMFFAREGFIVVALSWLSLSFIGALPLYFSNEIPSFTNALFETVSGFTTTGASILSDVESLSRSSQIWRSFTHWIGGMGVLVFILIILPLTGGSNMHLMKTESPGPSVSKLVPRLRTTAMILYGIYFFITISEIVCLILFKMPIFDALCISFGTAGTGGFSIKNDSLASYSICIQSIVTIFMFLFGINFIFYYYLFKKKFKLAFSISEVRCYFLIYLISGILISINIFPAIKNIPLTIHHAFFQTSAIMTTTGYSSVDFDLWPTFSKNILLIIMFIGACAGSTGGGIKVSRIMILFKQIKAELINFIHPRNIKIITIDKRKIEDQTIRQVLIFIITFIFVFVFSLFIISLDNFDFTTNFSAVAATINNIGPGFNKVGPMLNYNEYSILSKYVLMFCMLAGRLELYPLLLFFYPNTWKNK